MLASKNSMPLRCSRGTTWSAFTTSLRFSPARVNAWSTSSDHQDCSRQKPSWPKHKKLRQKTIFFTDRSPNNDPAIVTGPGPESNLFDEGKQSIKHVFSVSSK